MSLTVTARGTFTHNTSGTSFTCAVASNCTAGACIVICIAADNSAAAGSSNNFTTVTDSLGNTWTKHQSPVFDNGAASAGVQGAIYSTVQDVGTIQTGTTITVAFGAATVAKTGCFWEITAAAGFRANFRTGANKAAGATGTAVTLGASPSVNIGEALVAAVYMESGTTQTYTGDSDSTNGTWNTAQYAEIGSTTSGSCCGSQVKLQTTANSTQTYDATLGISSDYHGSYAIFQEVQINTDGTSNITFGSLTDSSAGKVDIAGAASITLDALTSSTTGAVDIQAAFSKSLDALTVTADGTVETVGGGIAGDANITFGSLTDSATGQVDILGAANLTLGSLTSSAAGKVDLAGVGNITLGSLTSTTAGKVDIAGLVNKTFNALTTTTAGKVDIAGLANKIFNVLTTTTAGKVDIAGVANKTLDTLTVTSTGTGFTETLGSANLTFGALTGSSGGQIPTLGDLNKSLGTLTVSSTGEVITVGGVQTFIDFEVTFGSLTLEAIIEHNWQSLFLVAHLHHAVEVQLDGTTKKPTS